MIREEILKQCEIAKQASFNLKNDLSKHEIIRKIADNIYRRANEIHEICSIEKYDLFFNGKVSIGKSTAISHLLGLTDNEQLDINCKISDLPLLKVAGGRTTVCETKITQTKEMSKVIIDKLPFDDFSKYISEFCDTLLGGENETGSANEINRVISNMAKFPFKENQISNEDMLEYIKTHLNDSNILTVDKNDLFKSLISSINYEGRSKTEYLYSGESNCQDWLKKLLIEINDGKQENCPFPSQIIVAINENDLKLNLPYFIKSVIDTRGIDGGIRNDIITSMKSMESITFMCDEIGSFGGNETIQKMLSQVIISGNTDLPYRVFLLGIEKDVFLQDSNGANNDRTKGKVIKTKEAMQKFNENGIEFFEKNILFYDPLSGIEYSSKSKEIREVNIEEYNKSKSDLLNEIDNCLQHMYRKYYNEVLQLLQNVTKMEENVITSVIIEKFEKSKEFINASLKAMATIKNSYISSLKNELFKYYAATLRGSVNRNGHYYNLNVYDESSYIGGREFATKCEKEKGTLIRQLDFLFDKNDETERICLDCLRDKINQKYKEYFEINSLNFKDQLRKSIETSSVWSKVQKYWGDKLGNYKERVISDIEIELLDKDIESLLNKENYYMSFFRDVEDFLQI